jgi:hypothetical protein
MISEALGGIPIKLDTDTGIVTVKDLKKFGVRGYVEYSPEECEAIRESTGEITPRVHLAKSVFDGEIVKEKDDGLLFRSIQDGRDGRDSQSGKPGCDYTQAKKPPGLFPGI